MKSLEVCRINFINPIYIYHTEYDKDIMGTFDRDVEPCQLHKDDVEHLLPHYILILLTPRYSVGSLVTIYKILYYTSRPACVDIR